MFSYSIRLLKQPRVLAAQVFLFYIMNSVLVSQDCSYFHGSLLQQLTAIRY